VKRSFKSWSGAVL